jgi:hypothetical protein
LRKKRGETEAANSDKKRQRTCRNMTPFVAGNVPPVVAFCRFQFNALKRLSTLFNASRSHAVERR